MAAAPAPNLTIDRDGTVRSDGQPVAKARQRWAWESGPRWKVTATNGRKIGDVAGIYPNAAVIRLVGEWLSQEEQQRP